MQRKQDQLKPADIRLVAAVTFASTSGEMSFPDINNSLRRATSVGRPDASEGDEGGTDKAPVLTASG